LLLGLVLVWLGYRFDSSLRSDKDIHEALHLRVLGRMPDFGKLHVQNGRQTT
jgi:capsular polysaccharide biosynthesis protein